MAKKVKRLIQYLDMILDRLLPILFIITLIVLTLRWCLVSTPDFTYPEIEYQNLEQKAQEIAENCTTSDTFTLSDENNFDVSVTVKVSIKDDIRTIKITRDISSQAELIFLCRILPLLVASIAIPVLLHFLIIDLYLWGLYIIALLYDLIYNKIQKLKKH